MNAESPATCLPVPFLEAILNSIDASVVTTDKDFVVQYWNKKAEALFNRLAVETIGQPAEFFLPFYEEGCPDSITCQLVKAGSWKGKLYQRNRNNQLMLLDASASIVKNDAGAVIGYVFYHRDITEADKAITSLATFLSFISSVDDSFFIVDRDMKVALADEKANNWLQRIYGFTYAVGDCIIEKLPKIRRQPVREAYQRALNGEKNVYEARVETVENRKVWLQASYFPIRDESGAVTHACSVVRNITAEKEIELVNEMLYRSRQMFETFMENSPILAWITDQDGIIRYLNPAYTETYHLQKTVIGKNWNTIFPQNIAVPFFENNKMVLANNEVMQATEKAFTPNGEEHIYKVYKFPIANDSETLVGGWAVDITEETALRKSVSTNLKKLLASEQELKAALAKEHQLNEMKSRFVSTASHEFRTPLSTILSSIYLLEKYTTTEQQNSRLKHAGKIKDSVQHMNALLEDFLSIGRLEEGKINLHPILIDMQELVGEITSELAFMNKPGQQVEVVCKGNEKFITDKKLLKNILTNLLSNALKFSTENKKIQLTLEAAEKTFTLVVQDEGIGISLADQEHLFETFYRAKNAQNIQGTGLGLHIVKSYVEMLSGQISLESAIGIGTTVRVSFPVQTDTI